MRAWLDARAWAPALVAVACVFGLGLAQLDPVSSPGKVDPRREPQLTQEAQALLGGLAVGEQIMGWTILALDGPYEGMLRVDVARDDVRFALMVAPKGRPESAPVETERYMIFYGHVQPPETVLPEGTIRATTNALARRIRAHEATVDVPGL